MSTQNNNIKFISELGYYISVSNECPYCHIAINPIIVEYTNPDLDKNFAIIFQCPSCEKYFFETYELDEEICEPLGYKPTLKLNLNIPDEIKTVSPKFVEIYTQAITAEHYGLNEILGIALRKAIEFLIKDYLINYKKKPEAEVKKLLLGKAINLIDNPKIQVLARATSWIGNDETHYERRYEDKDVNDMKRFITALLHFISFEFVLDEADSFTACSNSK